MPPSNGFFSSDLILFDLIIYYAYETMKEKQSLVIILPAYLAELPIRIVRSSNYKELIFSIQPLEDYLTYSPTLEKKYVFIWHQNDYVKVSLDEIMWLEASGSYTAIHLTGERTLLLSFHLGAIEKELPPSDFTRIHRSFMVNLKHVCFMMGNSLHVDGQLLTIGREYRDRLLDRFIFLGVRRKKK